jgi:hypothetical protein
MSKKNTTAAVVTLVADVVETPKAPKGKTPKGKTVEEKIAAMAERSAATELTVGGLIAEAEAMNVAEEAAPVVDKKAALRDEARSRMLNAKRATTAHGYALIGACDGDTDAERLDAMRAEIAKWPEAIRAAACKIGMECTAPGRRTHALLKHLHDEQPVMARSAGVRRGRNADGRIKLWSPKDGGSKLARVSIHGAQFTHLDVVFTTTDDGRTVITMTEVRE